jgi:ligand-binding SRPBCC domain-containing protein
MPIIKLLTKINAPAARCFDLSRSIDLHMASTSKTGEHVVAGRSSGLICMHESVTWKAKHLGIWQTLSSKITDFDPPFFFADEMVEGAFKSFRHEHYFSEEHDVTFMKDIFNFHSPFGIFGNLAEKLFLTRYMTRLLEERNALIKNCAENDSWQTYLKP